jgi:hypothetical protein
MSTDAREWAKEVSRSRCKAELEQLARDKHEAADESERRSKTFASGTLPHDTWAHDAEWHRLGAQHLEQIAATRRPEEEQRDMAAAKAEAEAAEARYRDGPMPKLIDEHNAEAERIGAEFYNFGWCTEENCITSKTSKGILSSTIDPETGEIWHDWNC